MRLFVSVLLLAFGPVALAQTGSPNPGVSPTEQAQPPYNDLSGDLVAHRVLPSSRNSCPLLLTSASVAPVAGLLPVEMRTEGDGALAVHFQNLSGREVRSAVITAHLRVKTDVYSLDATPIELQLILTGTSDVDRDLDQAATIPLPRHVYLFGVARVTLDRVTFADGQVWSAPNRAECAVSGPSSLRVDAK